MAELLQQVPLGREHPIDATSQIHNERATINKFLNRLRQPREKYRDSHAYRIRCSEKGHHPLYEFPGCLEPGWNPHGDPDLEPPPHAEWLIPLIEDDEKHNECLALIASDKEAHPGKERTEECKRRVKAIWRTYALAIREGGGFKSLETTQSRLGKLADVKVKYSQQAELTSSEAKAEIRGDIDQALLARPEAMHGCSSCRWAS